jgi:hypothetical protein
MPIRTALRGEKHCVALSIVRVILLKGQSVANYSMTPYAFALTPRSARGGERRPIDDLDGDGLTLQSLIDSTLQRFHRDALTIGAGDDSKSLRVNRMYSYDEFTFVEFGVGRAGLVGTLHQSSGNRVDYTADEHNESLIRGMFVYPSGAHEGYWLSERAGNNTAYSHFESLILRAIRDAVPSLTVKIDPVADWAAVREWASSVLVEELRFDAPRAGGSSQAIDANGLHGEVRVIVKPRGFTLNRIVNNSGADRDTVYGFLSNASFLSGTNVSPETLINEGWRARVAFKNPAGRQRSFGLALDDVGPTLVYQVGRDTAGTGRAYRPDDSEFATTCSEFFVDVKDSLPVGTTVAADIIARVL